MQHQPKQSQLNFLDSLPPMATENRAVQYKYINAELHVKVGFDDWVPSTQRPNPNANFKQPTENRMDLSKNDKPVKKPSPGLRVQSLPKRQGQNN